MQKILDPCVIPYLINSDISRTYKENLYNSTEKQLNVKIGQRMWIDISPKKIHSWQNKHRGCSVSLIIREIPEPQRDTTLQPLSYLLLKTQKEYLQN